MVFMVEGERGSGMSREHRDNFIFYRSFQDGINELREGDQLIIYRAIATYALNREEPELEGTAKLVWLLIKPQLDANWRKYDKGCKGGAPKGNSNAVRTGGKQPKTTKKQPNEKDNDNDNVKDNVNDNVTLEGGFVPPLLSDIESYISLSCLSVDAESFHDYYTSNGWMMGSNPMADWRAALRRLNRKTEQDKSKEQKKVSNDL